MVVFLLSLSQSVLMFYVPHEYDEICTNLDDIGNVGQLP